MRLFLDNVPWITLDEANSQLPPENMPEAGVIGVNLQFQSETPYLMYNVHLSDGIGGSTDSGDLSGAITTTYDDEGNYSISASVDEDQGWAMQTVWENSWGVNVYNVPPGATLDSQLLEDHETVRMTLSGPWDASSADTAAGFRVTFAPTYAELAQSYLAADPWPEVGDPSADFDIESSPSGTWYARIYDEDGGFSDYASTYVFPTVNTPVMTDTSVQLVWLDVAEGESSWVVQRALFGGNFTTVATLAPDSTCFLDEGLTPGTRYQWRVRAVGTPGTAEDTAWSAKRAAKTLTPASDLQISGSGGGQVQLSWNGDPDNTDAYEIEVGTTCIWLSCVTETTDQQIVLDAPTDGVPHYYRVVARRGESRATATPVASAIFIPGTGGGSDTIQVIQNADHSTADFIVTNTTTTTTRVPLSSTDLIIIDGGDSADHITIRYDNGNPIPVGGVRIVGGDQDHVDVDLGTDFHSAAIVGNRASIEDRELEWERIHSLSLSFGDGNDTLTCDNIEQISFDDVNHAPGWLSVNGGPGDDHITIDGASNIQVGVEGDVGDDWLSVGNISVNVGGGVEIKGGRGDDDITVHDMQSLDASVYGDGYTYDTANGQGGRDTLRVQVDDDDAVENPLLEGGHGWIWFDAGDPRDSNGERTGEGPKDVLIVDMSEMPDTVSGYMSVGYHKDPLDVFSHTGVKVQSGGTDRAIIVCDPLYEEGWEFMGGDGNDRIDLGARPPDVESWLNWFEKASVSGGPGDDVIGVGRDLDADDTIAGNNLDGFVGLKFDGGDGSDELAFYDQDNPSTSSRHYQTSNTAFQLPGTLSQFNWDTTVLNIERVGAYMAPKKAFGSAYFDVNGTPSNIQLFIAGSTGTDININGSAHPVLLRPGTGAYDVDIQGSASAAIDFDHDHTPSYEWYDSRLMLNDVTIRVGGTLGVADGVGTRALGQISNLTMYITDENNMGTLDIGQVGLKIEGFTQVLLDDETLTPIGSPTTGLTAMQPFINEGYNGGLWNGTAGIRSSVPSSDSNATGIFVLTGADYFSYFPSVWTMDGAAFATTDILLRCTWKGDATLDGMVDLLDLYQVGDHYNQTVSGSDLLKWFQGDFNLSGNVNVVDLTTLSIRWQWGVS